MRCVNPLNARKDMYGNLAFNNKLNVATGQGLQFECRKCLPCRLNNAREKAVRCLHGAKMYEDNIFLTLTYKDESLESQWLIYEHFQQFMKTLRRKNPNKKIPYMVTGEYGEKDKRPHWHAIIFNYRPTDATPYKKNQRGETLYLSPTIDNIWTKNDHELCLGS